MKCIKCAEGYQFAIDDDNYVVIYKYPKSIKDAKACIVSLINSGIYIDKGMLINISQDLTKEDAYTILNPNIVSNRKITLTGMCGSISYKLNPIDGHFKTVRVLYKKDFSSADVDFSSSNGKCFRATFFNFDKNIVSK
jgi:hypothetical protein